jgi:polyhydroxybutyrate depolymerase
MRFALLAIVLFACGSDPSEPRPLLFGGDRPVELEVPQVLDEGREYPLVLVLHGYGFNGFGQAAFFQLSGLPRDNEALLLAPDGTVDSTGKQFWNADPTCCDFDGSNPDDVGYLGTLLEDVMAAWPVDRSSVFVVGHSNGAFMGYRMACERADLITAGAILAGNTSRSATACAPSDPSSMLIMHGTADVIVPYDGTQPTNSPLEQPTIGAVESRARWAQYDGCLDTTTAGAALDLDQAVAGSETRVEIQNNCSGNIGVELWTLEGVGHVPAYSSTFGPTLWSWLTDHRRD